MRLLILGVFALGLSASAQELSAPPLPPDTTQADEKPARRFSSRISFFSTSELQAFEIAIGDEPERCKTPCAFETHGGQTRITISGEEHIVTETRLVPFGESHALIRTWSPPAVVGGAIMMGVSATALLAAAVMFVIFPSAFALWLIAIVAPSVAIGVPGVVLTSFGRHKPSFTLVPFDGSR